ncbi:RNA polymerase factor sigma-54 [Paenibacillus ginsengarvi]|uniref:RNA polymerase sigma-54 factor n=1 Tax=Paenibacillus ginsengarvi TaxID=400777 RepID=A0A3B0CJU2_9BACL|nr:RNA polymerase factor sigma-54 [Paenibacillus ginsengarvi]RKN84978.1 RNA polymerase sigma-54 factor [Paenibacillus ginsengarvi]
MKMNATLGQTQAQQLSLSPQLKQSLYILQLSAAGLADYLQEQSLGNPLLSVAWRTPGMRKRRSGGSLREGGGAEPQDQGRRSADTLESVLLEQLHTSGIGQRRMRIARFLAGNLDDSGYMAISVQEAADVLGESLTEVEDALRHLQMLEPAGIAARNIRECLLLQIASKRPENGCAAIIVEDCLDDVAGGRLKKIADKLGITIEEVRQAVGYIRGLDPRPGLRFSSSLVGYIEPDAYIRAENGRFAVEWNAALVPNLSIDANYERLLSNPACRETKAFLSGSLRSAKWLIRGVEQRYATLLRVLTAIAELQSDFLQRGIGFLQPMTMKTVADRLGLHESTVSRAVRDKFVQTPQGLYELGHLFTSGVPTVSGGNASAESVKVLIRQYIDGENKRNPLSDQQMADRLAAEGIRISRRTVMKYREQIQLLSSRLRADGSPIADKDSGSAE